MLVAEGAADACVDAPGLSVWDLAAVQVVVEEAGGRLTDFEGARRIDGGQALTSNGRVHDEVLAALRSSESYVAARTAAS
jgi:histidinol-phosphatase